MSTSTLLQESDLHPYQQQAISFALTGGRVGLFLSPGLGKTVIALTLIKQTLKQGEAWLVVCPLRVMDTWETEIAEWSHLQGLRVQRVHGPNKAEALQQEADIYLINYEAIVWLYEQLAASKGRDAPFRHLILDESQRMKAHNTKRWKKFRHMIPMFDRRVLLTGTPLGGGGLEGLWTQTYVLDQGKTFGHGITAYRAMYFDRVGFNFYKYEPKIGAEERIWNRLKPLCLSMRAVDKLDMPELIRNEITVQLPASVRKIYDTTEREFFLELPGEVPILPPNAAATSMKLRQIAQGGVFDEDKQWHPLHAAKVEALLALIDELQGTPLIVFYQFRAELAAIRRHLPDVPVIAGGTGPADTAQIIRDFNRDEIPVLCAHPRSASLGLNLQKGSAHNICWLAPTWSLEEFIQAEARLWRQGQDRGVVVHHIIADKTVDRAIMSALKGKDRTQSALIRALIQYREGKHVQ